MHRIAMRLERDAVLDLEGRLGAEVVPKVLADAREMTNHGYPELPQLVLGADAREHQQLGRSDRPGAQHHAARLDVEYLSSAFGFDADGLAILDQDLPDEHPAPHRQVQMVAHRIEMRHGRAHSHAVDIVRGRHTEAGGMQAVLVVRGAEPRLHTGRMEGLLDGRPGT